jgi:peroxidase
MVASQGLQVGFYDQSCPLAETIVRAVVAQGVQQDHGIAPGLIRLHFHDCFVRGCDGSVLLDGPKSEKVASPNFSLRGFAVVDVAKAELEKQCPGIVSCADLLAFAARDSIELTGGKRWDVPAGRRDGTVSNNAEAEAMLPSPSLSVQQLTDSFTRKGLSQSDMITLSGAHTIGRIHCSTVVARLYPTTDPNLDVALAEQLKTLCPQVGGSSTSTFNLDPTTPELFDNMYYSNLLNGKGVLQSDQILFESWTTKLPTMFNILSTTSFTSSFADSMLTMSKIEVKTGSEGEIRRHCRVVNPTGVAPPPVVTPSA